MPANPVVVGGFAELTHTRICLILMLCGGVKKWHSKNSYSVEEILLDATELTARCEKLNSGILCSYVYYVNVSSPGWGFFSTLHGGYHYTICK